MNLDTALSSDRQLIYTREARPGLALAMIFLGPLLGLTLLGLVFTYGGTVTVEDGRTVHHMEFHHWIPVLLGAGLTLVVPLIGFDMGLSKRLVLDRETGQLTRSWRWFGLSGSRRSPLGQPTSVGWHIKRETRHSGEGGTTTSTTYPVKLQTQGVKPLPPLFIPDSADEARRLTREIGDFLGIPQHHWDEQIQDPSFEVARQLVHKQSDEVRAARRFGLEQPIEVRADPGADRLTLARRRGRGPVSGFVRFWGLTVALMGLFFLALPLIGGTFNGRADAFLEPILIGAAMLAAGLLIALLRRGTTIDRRDQTVSFWWGIPRPLWATRQDLSRYSAVRVGRRVEDDAIVGTVGLDGPDNPELVLHSSKDLMEVQSLAENIARFLNWPVQGNPA